MICNRIAFLQLPIALAAMLAAGAARAQTTAAIQTPPGVTVGAPAVGTGPNLSDSRAIWALPYAQADTAAKATMPTAINLRLAPGALIGSLGYLCGLQPGPNDNSGPASTFGPTGTFLGTKLSYAF